MIDITNLSDEDLIKKTLENTFKAATFANRIGGESYPDYIISRQNSFLLAEELQVRLSRLRNIEKEQQDIAKCKSE